MSRSLPNLEMVHFVGGFGLKKNLLLPVDLLMEHIQEIRSLRKRLEESIRTNEKLRRQLERQEPDSDRGEGGLPRAARARARFPCDAFARSACREERHTAGQRDLSLNPDFAAFL